jgi:hypothetical protein
VENLEIAGQQLTREELLKYIPEKARYIATPRDYFLEDPSHLIPFVAPHRLFASVPALDGFVVFRIER